MMLVNQYSVYTVSYTHLDVYKRQGIGIGRIGGSAMDAIARQPEATGKIQTAMLIAAALIEGIGFAALFAV